MSFKMVKRNISFYEKRKETITKYEFWTKGKVHMNFSDKENVDIVDFWEYKQIFSTQGVGRKVFT